MNRYRVEWSIDIDARSARQAAELALAMQRDLNSTATVFECIDCETGEIFHVDLEE